MIENLLREIGPLAGALNQMIGSFLWLIGVVAVAGLLLLRTLERRAVRRFQAGLGRGNAAKLGQKLLRRQHRRTMDEEEFEQIFGMPRSKYMMRTYLGVLIGGAVAYLLLNSWGLALCIVVGGLFIRMSGAREKLDAARGLAMSKDLIPAATSIASALLSSQSLSEAIERWARSSREPTPLSRGLRRAAASSNGLQYGLRTEQEMATQVAIREFYEILADGAGTKIKGADTARILEQFVDANRRRKTAWDNALFNTAQARGTRSIVFGLVMLMLFVSTLSVGFDVMLATNGGNSVIVMSGVLLLFAMILSNGVINKALKDF